MPDIILKFRGEEFTIPDGRAFEAGEAVEEIATLIEVGNWSRRPRFFKMSRCVGALLRIAGAKVTDREVHRDMMSDYTQNTAINHFATLNLLLSVLMDGAPDSKGGGDPGKAQAAS